MPISIFTVGALEDIWTSVNYAMADPYSCPGPFFVAATKTAPEADFIVLKPIGAVAENGTVVPL